MTKGEFKIIINAQKEKVWKILWTDETYRKWTSVFAEGSYMKSDWKVGGKTLFLNGKSSGMVSTIVAVKPNEYISFKHLGMLNDGIEDLESETVKQWSGSLENYILKSVGEKTELSIELDLHENYKDYISKTFPAALNNVKELSEK